MKWLFIAIAFLPQVIFAQTDTGLVSCSGPDCNFCDFITMINELIQWLFGILAIVAVLVLVWSGFILVTSAGNPAALQKAKGFFSNVVIGFAIVLSAWLIVDTVMKALVDQAPPTANGGGGFGPWNEFDADCGGINDPLENQIDSIQDGNNIRGRGSQL